MCILAQEPPLILNVDLNFFKEHHGIEDFSFYASVFSPLDMQSVDFEKIYQNRKLLMSQNHIQIDIENNNLISYLGSAKAGDFVLFQTREDNTNRFMRVWVRVHRNLALQDIIDVIQFKFEAGTFFYDALRPFGHFSLYKEGMNSEKWNMFSPLILNLQTINKKRIAEKTLQRIANKDRIATPKEFIIPKSNGIEEELIKFKFLPFSAHKNDTLIGKERFYIRANTHEYLGYFSIRQVTVENYKTIGLSIMNEKGALMNILFKIFKRYNDDNLNQINLKGFQFKKGNYYYNMETYSKDDCQTESMFINEFDIDNIENHSITYEEMNTILLKK